jgi:hypothetical protein
MCIGTCMSKHVGMHVLPQKEKTGLGVDSGKQNMPCSSADDSCAWFSGKII